MYGWRAQVGLIVPSVNTCTEPQFRRMAPPGVEFYVTRLRLRGDSAEELLAMGREVEQAARLLADLQPSFILFHCTGASVIGGVGYDAEIRRRIEAVAGCPAGATATGVVRALRALKAQRVALITPYREALNRAEMDFLEGHGIRVVTSIALAIERAADYVRMEPGDWYRIVRGADLGSAEAIFISCTNIRVIEAIEWIERDAGLPVVTSNQAALWHVLRCLRIADQMNGFGRLLREWPSLQDQD